MAIQRGRPDGQAEELAGLREERRSLRTSFVGVGSLACPNCDAPAPLAQIPASPASAHGCPYCAHTGAVRDFLSFGGPPRPARVNIYVRDWAGV